ncbi:MAG: O-antigen ligase family protein [Coriobacteriia bacterium]|nr:O-antigen ligase family protein [Coriobacteriia bacterium]
MQRSSHEVIGRYWPAALIGVSLVAPIFIDTIAHSELFMTFLLAGFAAAAVAAARRGSHLHVPKALTISLAALILYLGARALFAPEPLVALYGAYSSDGTVLWLVSAAVATLGASAWASGRLRGEPASSDGVVWSLIAISTYCAASGVAGWLWGPTDTVGGLPSGFTPNSQYQLQLLTVGMTAAIAWGLLKRRNVAHVVPAALALVVIAVNIGEARAAAAPVALAVAAIYVASLVVALPRLTGRVFAGVWTALVGIAGTATAVAVLSENWSVRTVTLLDSLGNARGTLWSSAARIVEGNPLFGRGLAHATPISRWTFDGGTFDVTTTTDPHNVFFLLATGGGVVAVILGLAVLFFMQLSVFEATRAAARAYRPALLVLVAGTAALFVLSQFAFAYPVAWTLGGLLVGLVLAAGATPQAAARPPGRKGLLLLAGAAALLAFVAAAWVPTPNRAASLRLSSGAWMDPAIAVARQLALVEDSWDVMPMETANDILSTGLAAGAPQAVGYLPLAEQKRGIVKDNMAWDARLAASELHLWAAQTDAGATSAAALREAVEAGMLADPASGFWATAGTALLAEHDEQTAIAYAKLVRSDPLWAMQAERNADAATVALIEQLAER